MWRSPQFLTGSGTAPDDHAIFVTGARSKRMPRRDYSPDLPDGGWP